MTDSGSHRWEGIYEAALALPVAEREEYLRTACAGDEGLRARIRRMLANAEEAPGFLEMPAEVELELDEAPERDALVGRRIGRYEVLGVLGHGGMGVVYDARQDTPRRRVALKLLRPGRISSELLRRFEREAELLGRLHHSAIAQVYEAGTVKLEGEEERRPFIAMELVDGRPISRYATDHGLGAPERLELMARVCDGVQHAHQRGVIHRDLKPGNVLVTDAGEPKILDFGVARATDSDIAMTTLRTSVGQIVGTIAYMSPEQAGGRTAEVDTRSDVYSLGVMLFELLSGRLPHDVVEKPIAEAVRTISTEDPTHLSTVDRSFRGDVDTIVAKALEKEPARRYQSAAELAADIRRHLADEPITARPASRVYQLRKFARRNRALVGGVAATMAVLVIALAVVTALAVRFQREKIRAQEINWFMDSVLTAANPYSGISEVARPRYFGGNARLVEVLDEIVKQLDERPLRDPIAEATIRWRMSEAYVGMSRHMEGVRQARGALELLKGRTGSASKLRLKAKLALGWALNHSQSDSLGAVRNTREVVEECEAVYGQAHPETLDAMWRLAVCYDYAGYGVDCVDVCESILARADTTTPPGAFAAFITKAGLLGRGYIMWRCRPAAGEAIIREAIVEGTAIGQEDTCFMALAYHALGHGAAERGAPAEAEAHCRKGMEIWAEVAGDLPSLEFCVHLGLYVLLQPGRAEEGLAILRDGVAARIAQVGEDDMLTAFLIRRYAEGLQYAGRVAEAESEYRRYIGIMKRVRVPGSLEPAVDYHRFAEILATRGKIDEAEFWLREGLRIADGFPRENRERFWWDDRLLLVDLGRVLSITGREAEAEQVYATLRERIDEGGDPMQANRVAWRLWEAGRYAESESIARSAIERLRPFKNDTKLGYYNTLDTWAAALHGLGRSQEAADVWREGEAMRAGAPQEMPAGHDVRLRFAECLVAIRSFEEAEGLVRGIVAALEAADPPNVEMLTRARKTAIALYEAWGKPELAAAYVGAATSDGERAGP